MLKCKYSTITSSSSIPTNNAETKVLGSGMDCAVIPCSRYKDISLVQTVDFFYPLVDDPQIMGRIALANVVSDIYAVGVTEIDDLQMIISSPTDFNENERNVILPMIIQGFNDSAKSVGCSVHIQNITVNPWCMIGGVATSVSLNSEIILPYYAKDGDHLILTKPLGTQLATNANIWLIDKCEKYEKLRKHFSDADIKHSFEMALQSMTHLNKDAAKLMHKYGANAATDITGFGLAGHAQNLAECQKDCLQFCITKLPILKNVLKFSEILSSDKKLRSGRAVETSGGLLICMPASNSEDFCKDYHLCTNGRQTAWVVGYVQESVKREAVLSENPEFIEVEL